ncbi:hypothetical protein BPTFM16_01817 [Altererythrobacter insulae]|nr:hypothetical protein BPTFM16_01817 [Altererythrobacter insulae]
MIDALSAAEWIVTLSCANPLKDLSSEIDALDGRDLTELLSLSLATRTAGLVQRSMSDLDNSISGQIREAAKQYGVHNLRAGQALAETSQLLASGGFSPIALKGAGLALADVYPDPKLRPLRDLDLLLAPIEAMAAQEYLLEHQDFTAKPKSGRYGLEHGHQLPELVHKPTGVILEIHHRLYAGAWEGEKLLLEHICQHAQTREILGVPVSFPDTLGNLMHLVEHATVHHAFANGPLILSDLHFLMSNHDLTGRQVERAAQRFGLSRAWSLVRQAATIAGATWSAKSTDADGAELGPQVAAAFCTMVMNDEAIAQHDQMRRLGTRGKSVFGALSYAMRPDPNELAKLAGQSTTSAKRWLGYPKWLWSKGLRFTRGRRNLQLTSRFEQRDLLIDWLAE